MAGSASGSCTASGSAANFKVKLNLPLTVTRNLGSQPHWQAEAQPHCTGTAVALALAGCQCQWFNWLL